MTLCRVVEVEVKRILKRCSKVERGIIDCNLCNRRRHGHEWPLIQLLSHILLWSVNRVVTWHKVFCHRQHRSTLAIDKITYQAHHWPKWLAFALTVLIEFNKLEAPSQYL
jgi:hypothetical protein